MHVLLKKKKAVESLKEERERMLVTPVCLGAVAVPKRPRYLRSAVFAPHHKASFRASEDMLVVQSIIRVSEDMLVVQNIFWSPTQKKIHGWAWFHHGHVVPVTCRSTRWRVISLSHVTERLWKFIMNKMYHENNVYFTYKIARCYDQ